MGFFKNIGTKTYDDINDYIRNKEWMTRSKYYGPNGEGEEWYITKNNGIYFLIGTVYPLWGPGIKGYKIRVCIDEYIPVLFEAMCNQQGIQFVYDIISADDKTISEKYIVELHITIFTQDGYITAVKQIIDLPNQTIKIKFRSEPDNAAYIKDQQRLAQRYSNRRGWR